MADSCDECGETTVQMPDGRHLNPIKSRVGRYLPDGTEITPDDLRQGVRAHHLHFCPPHSARHRTPTATPSQGSLF